jgi:hypothetical protein
MRARAASCTPLLALLAPLFLEAQTDEGLRILEESEPGDTVWVSPRSSFDANLIQRFFLGAGYRDVWGMPLRARILDLDSFKGGLFPLRKGGGLQTPSLRFRSREGPVYTFRSLDKDAARALDPELRTSIVADVAQDFVSAILPEAALILDRIQEAAGVLHASPELVLMPDDPRLGEFRQEFAGRLGWIEVRADEGPEGGPGFAGSPEVKGSEAFMDDLEEEEGVRVDARAYLKARLIDVLVGDWDRHPDQWRWAAFPEEEGIRYFPVPRDRDWALTRLDGFKMVVARIPWPEYVGFDDEIPRAFRITWSGRVLDRLILPRLTWEEWESVAREVVDSLPDPVIESAVRRISPRPFQTVGKELIHALRNRRDQIPGFAREYYLFQAETPHLHTTDQDEEAVFQRLKGGRLKLTVFRLDGGEALGDPTFDRVFLPEETREVRLDLHGGNDRARVRGPGSGRIRITVEGGGGDDLLAVTEGSDGHGVHFFDHRGDNVFRRGPGTRVDERSWEDPHDWRDDTHWAGTRDWGARTVGLPRVLVRGDGGLILGATLVRTGYGFRYHPHRDRSRFSLAFGTRTGKLHVEAATELPLRRPSILGRLEALGTGAYVRRYYGLGNETEGGGGLSRYEAFGLEYRLQGAVSVGISPALSLEGGAGLTLHDPEGNQGTVLAEERPYGYEKFTSFSLFAGLRWDRRDDLAWPTEGWTLEVGGRYFPELADVASGFGRGRISGTTYLSAPGFPLSPTLALQAGGEKAWGDFPYQEAAVLGGSRGLRGFPEERFRGDASLFGASELRVRLGSLPPILPGSWGATASAERGRVWWRGEDSDRWHDTYGGGVWASILDTFTVSLSLARSDEGTRFLYGGGGFQF